LEQFLPAADFLRPVHLHSSQTKVSGMSPWQIMSLAA
jgi:hypothetical protein